MSASCRADGLTGLVRNASIAALSRSSDADRRARISGKRHVRADRPDRLGELDAVHLGHPQVEDRDVEGLAPPGSSASASVGDAVSRRLDRPAPQLGGQDPAVGRVVVDDEDAPAGELDRDDLGR